MPKLSDLQIDEVSLVRKGANQHAHVAIAKSAEGEPGGIVEEYFDADGNAVGVDELEHGDIVFDGNGDAFQYSLEDEDGDVEKSWAGAKGVARLAGSDARTFAGSIPGRARRTGKRLGDATRRGAASTTLGASATGGQVARGLSNGAGKVQRAAGNVANTTSNAGSNLQGFARVHPGAAAAGGLGALALGGGAGYGAGRVRKSFENEVRTELSKALTDDDRDEVISKALGYMEALEEQVSKAQEVAEAERDARLDQEFLEVAKSYVTPVSDEELAATLRACAESLDPEHIEVIRKCLEVASDAMFSEYGSAGGGDNNDIMSQVSAASAAQFAKSAGSGTPEQFTAAYFEQNPEAYDAIISGYNGR